MNHKKDKGFTIIISITEEKGEQILQAITILSTYEVLPNITP